MSNNHIEQCNSLKSIDNAHALKTKSGISSQIYSKQMQSSIKRNHHMPTYSRVELFMWLNSDWLFDLLFNNWANCGYITDMKPSIDRIDNKLGYTFENIRVTTWLDNKLKEHYHLIGTKKIIRIRTKTKNGVYIRKENPIDTRKVVLKLNVNSEFVCEYASLSMAARENNLKIQNISLCCKGKRNHTGGFKWGFKYP